METGGETSFSDAITISNSISSFGIEVIFLYHKIAMESSRIG